MMLFDFGRHNHLFTSPGVDPCDINTWILGRILGCYVRFRVPRWPRKGKR